MAAAQARVETPEAAEAGEPEAWRAAPVVMAVTASAEMWRARAAILPDAAAPGATPRGPVAAPPDAVALAAAPRAPAAAPPGAAAPAGPAEWAAVGATPAVVPAVDRPEAAERAAVVGQAVRPAEEVAQVGPLARVVVPTQAFRVSSTAVSARRAIAAVAAARVRSGCALATRSARATPNAPGRMRCAGARRLNQRPGSALTPASAFAADGHVLTPSRVKRRDRTHGDTIA